MAPAETCRAANVLRIATERGAWPALCATRGPGWTDAATLAAEGPPEAWLDRMADGRADVDAKARGALLAAELAYSCAGALAYLALGHRMFLDPRSGPFGFRERSVSAHDDHGPRIATRIDPRQAVIDPASDPASLSRTALTTLAPAISGIARRTGLSQAALWRQAADAFAYAFLVVGRKIGAEAEGVALGRAALACATAPLANRQTGYLHVTAPPRSEWFVRRGGCCRWFTVDGEKCLTCVLRPLDERRAVLAARLRDDVGAS